MRELFSMDRKDYKGTEKVFSRPSARAIIEKDGKLLLVYSRKYDYYKFPGGGIEKGETGENALIREVLEETGYRVIPESIKEYGYVLKRQLSNIEDNTIFEQYNYYYLCEVEDMPGEQKLDDYESEEGFTAFYIEPVIAASANFHSPNHWSEDMKKDLVKVDMVKRDRQVIDMYDVDRRRMAREKHEKEVLKNMGSLDYAGMMDFVEKTLQADRTEDIEVKVDLNYSRFLHTKRVLGWALRLYDAAPDKSALSYEDVMIATIFHDVGRGIADKQNISHAKAGVPITRQYLLEHGFSEERTEYICSLVEGHSDKYRMNEENLDRNLLLLMEADLLDDMGALGIVMDCMITRGRNDKATFADCYDHIMRFTHRQQQTNPMTTPEGRAMWDEKTKLVEAFTKQLGADITL